LSPKNSTYTQVYTVHRLILVDYKGEKQIIGARHIFHDYDEIHDYGYSRLPMTWLIFFWVNHPTMGSVEELHNFFKIVPNSSIHTKFIKVI